MQSVSQARTLREGGPTLKHVNILKGINKQIEDHATPNAKLTNSKGGTSSERRS